MYKLRLNSRLKFDAIILHQKQNGRAKLSSVSDFLMNTCQCLHNDNGHFKLECYTGECSKCLKHTFYVQNDKYHLKKILKSASEIGPIFHLDYSENLQTNPKSEPQSVHFNKRQHSSHCAIAHTNHIDPNDDVGKHLYLYHLADDMKHKYGFTFTVVETIIDLFDFNTNCLRFKSNNCKAQYKCKNAFANWSKISVQLKKKIIME